MRGRRGVRRRGWWVGGFGGGLKGIWFSVELGVCCFSLRVFLGGGGLREVSVS